MVSSLQNPSLIALMDIIWLEWDLMTCKSGLLESIPCFTAGNIEDSASPKPSHAFLESLPRSHV